MMHEKKYCCFYIASDANPLFTGVSNLLGLPTTYWLVCAKLLVRLGPCPHYNWLYLITLKWWYCEVIVTDSCTCRCGLSFCNSCTVKFHLIYQKLMKLKMITFIYQIIKKYKHQQKQVKYCKKLFWVLHTPAVSTKRAYTNSF